MARDITEICDLCKRPTKRIAGKLFYTPLPLDQGVTRSSFHNNYKMHLDVGECCEQRMKTNWKWTERLSAAAYQAMRKKRAGKK